LTHPGGVYRFRRDPAWTYRSKSFLRHARQPRFAWRAAEQPRNQAWDLGGEAEEAA